MTTINALVLYGYGLNCDMETAYALELAGAKPQRVHINSVIDESVVLDNFQIMVFVGGFSWGDDHGAGVIQAVRMKTNGGDRIIDFVEKGNLVLGICNGFQTLVNIGLLPGIDHDYRSRSVALTFNDCGNFRDDWVHLNINPKSPCAFTRGMDRIDLPVRHGEGKFIAGKEIYGHLSENHQIVCRYAMPDGTPASGKFPFNPNGSLDDIAGICDSTGRVFGLMPHPEAFNHPTNHPHWTRIKEKIRRGYMPSDESPQTGIRIFQNAVTFFS
ncbi:MAG: phosphoribosylformylglycinamidine synthase subunit PurQ [Desulfobacterales bacterium]|nr:phosphoribosylformylglycinamidine synthase subunit PurQ [Desulfobacterales bacterium]